jgi:hypothetical protein
MSLEKPKDPIGEVCNILRIVPDAIPRKLFCQHTLMEKSPGRVFVVVLPLQGPFE